MRILVTGASGLLGINLALEAAKEHTVYGLVNQKQLQVRPGQPELPFQVLQADLLIPGEIQRVLDLAQPDWIIHCAALAIVDECEAQPERAYQLNTRVPAELAADVRKGGARLVHISTDAVFDGLRGGYTEDDVPNPLSTYGHTKLAGERAVVEANSEALIARVNLIGWSISGKRSLSEFFYNNLAAGKAISGFTDVFFCPLLANDLAVILLEMLQKGLSGLFHVASRDSSSKYEFGVRLAQRFGLDDQLIRPTLVSQSSLKAARSPRLTLETAKLTHALGYPPPNIESGLERLYRLFEQGTPQRLQQLG